MRARGFSLIELIVAITIAGIIAAFIGMFLKTPTDAYFAQVHRADLTDSADAIVRMVEQDIPSALPYSVRISSSGSYKVMSFLLTADAARYFVVSDTADPTRTLDFSTADNKFAIDGNFNSTVTSLLPLGIHLAVMNGPTSGAQAWSLSSVITPNGTSFGITPTPPPPVPPPTHEDQITVTPAFRFAGPSNSNTVFAVTGPVTYICNEAAGTITRFWNYPISSTQYINPASFPPRTRSSLVARFATRCQFTSLIATAEHGDVVSVRVLLTEVTQGQGTEQLQLFHQVGESRAP